MSYAEKWTHLKIIILSKSKQTKKPISCGTHTHLKSQHLGRLRQEDCQESEANID